MFSAGSNGSKWMGHGTLTLTLNTYGDYFNPGWVAVSSAIDRLYRDRHIQPWVVDVDMRDHSLGQALSTARASAPRRPRSTRRNGIWQRRRARKQEMTPKQSPVPTGHRSLAARAPSLTAFRTRTGRAPAPRLHITRTRTVPAGPPAPARAAPGRSKPATAAPDSPPVVASYCRWRRPTPPTGCRSTPPSRPG